MADLDSVLRAEGVACADTALGDPLLAEMARRAELYDERGDIPLVLNLSDGSRVSGILSSDIKMAKACDAPLEQLWAKLQLLPDASQEARDIDARLRPTLGGRSLNLWCTDIHEYAAGASRRAAKGGDTFRLEDADDADLLFLAAYAKRGALTLRNATLRQHGKCESVPMLRVTISAITTWWVDGS